MPSSKSFRLIQFVGDAIKQVLQTYSVCEWCHQTSPASLTNWISLKDLLDGITHKLNKSEGLAWWHSLWVMPSSKSFRLIQFVSDAIKQVFQTNSVCEWCHQASPSDTELVWRTRLIASLTNWISQGVAGLYHSQTELVWRTCLMTSLTNWISLKDLLWVMPSSKSFRLIQFVSDAIKQVLQTNSVCEWCRQASPSD
jgi:hypothetical protein